MSKIDYSLYHSVTTRYGVIRYLRQEDMPGYYTSRTQSGEELKPLNISVVALIEDGGLLLPDGLTYVTPKDREIRWHIYGGIGLTKMVGNWFPVRALKEVGKKSLENFSTTHSEASTWFGEVILDSYLSGDFGPIGEDVTLVMKAQEVVKDHRARIRHIVELSEELNNSGNKNIFSEVRDLTGTTIYAPRLPNMALDF